MLRRPEETGDASDSYRVTASLNIAWSITCHLPGD